jgi:hypothetical protein
MAPEVTRSLTRPSEPIDVVYTWVDGTRSDYLALLGRYTQNPRDLNPERFRDSFECLRHSLRGLEQNAPWVRDVYLFTCRPQVPSWLKREHPRLRIVHHDEVMPGDILPTFNSNVIESYLHELPGLSRRFLYFNDDYFAAAPLTRSHFFAPDGRMKVYGSIAGEYLRSRIYERHWISLGLLEHGPVLIDREELAAALSTVQDDIAKTRARRFRNAQDVRIERLYRWYLLTRRRDVAVAEPCWRYLRYARFHKVDQNLARNERACARLLRRTPALLCLNDDQRANPNPGVVAAVRTFLATLFPSPSSFEAQSSSAPRPEAAQ